MHRFAIRVYYEDTDLAGIVYYANYLRFIERARTEWLREIGVDQTVLKAKAGVVFVVRHVDADYLRPAHFDDLLTVESRLCELGNARVVMDQVVMRGEERLFASRVTLVCVGANGRATRMPEGVAQLLQQPHAGAETP